VNASVEVVLDNSDGRIPSSEGGEVKLLRMVGLKKDEYFLNARRSTKQEIATLLDMAGISSSNPSNIIAQGEVAALAGMSDERRLRMLQEVAGTQVYEQRRAESLRILTTTEEKREAIRGLMGDLDEKIGELARESAELAEFNAAERKRRAIEYVLFSAELSKATEALQELDANTSGAGNDAELRSGHDAAATTVVGLAKDVAARKSDLVLATAEVAAAKKALPKLQERRVKLGEKTSNARGSVEADALGSEEAGKELARVEVEVAKKRAELAAGEPAFQAAQAALDAARAAASTSEQRVNALSDKAGRSSKFKSRKERDTFLHTLVGQHRGEHGVASKLAADHAKGAAAHGERGQKLAAEAAALEKAGADRGKEAALVAGSLDDLAAARASATSAAHSAKARLDDADKAASELGGKAEAAAKAVFANMPQALRRGLEEIARLSDPSSPVYLPGIYGPLVDLVRPSHERYNLPVEAVAGPEIFNVIVADDGVAASIVAHLAKAKAGRVTLVPLNRIKPAEQQYPASEDCRSLTSFLQFDDKFAPAVKQQFGRVLLCKSSEVAAKYAREQGFICVTLEGDTANKRGALTGGFIDPSAARLKHVKVRQEAVSQLTELKAERAKIEAEVAAADVAVRGAAIKLGDSEDKARKLRDDAAALVLEAERKRREVAGERAKAEVAGREAVRVKEQADLLAGRIADLEAEIASEMSSKLTPAEQATLESFSAQAEATRKAASQTAAAFESRRSVRQDVTTQLEDNLLKRAAELRGRLSRTSSTGISGDRRDELRQLENQFQAAVIAEKAALAAMESQQKRVAAQETELAKLNEDYSAASSALATVADSLRDAQLQDEKVRIPRGSSLELYSPSLPLAVAGEEARRPEAEGRRLQQAARPWHPGGQGARQVLAPEAKGARGGARQSARATAGAVACQQAIVDGVRVVREPEGGSRGALSGHRERRQDDPRAHREPRREEGRANDYDVQGCAEALQGDLRGARAARQRLARTAHFGRGRRRESPCKRGQGQGPGGAIFWSRHHGVVFGLRADEHVELDVGWTTDAGVTNSTVRHPARRSCTVLHP